MPPFATVSAFCSVSEETVALVVKRLVDEAIEAKSVVEVALVRSVLPVSVVEASKAETEAVSSLVEALPKYPVPLTVSAVEEAYTKYEVEEAKNPLWNQSVGVDVA